MIAFGTSHTRAPPLAPLGLWWETLCAARAQGLWRISDRAEVSESVDEHDLGSCAFGRVGSSPTFRTTLSFSVDEVSPQASAGLEPQMTPRRNTTAWELGPSRWLHVVHGRPADCSSISTTKRSLQARAGSNSRVIHGWGASGQGGTLRSRLRQFLSGYRDSLEFTHLERMSMVTAAVPM